MFRRFAAIAAKIGTYLVPPRSILLGWLRLGESPVALAYVGGALCLLGVGISRRSGLAAKATICGRLRDLI
jgi:drug/metabolite transporter (DMT)-like permease